MSSQANLLPILPTFNKVLFPGLIVKLHIAPDPKLSKNAKGANKGSPMINYLFDSFKLSPNQETLTCAPVAIDNLKVSNSPDYYNELNFDKLKDKLVNCLTCTAKIISITPSNLIKDGFLLVLEGGSRARVTKVISSNLDLPRVELSYIKEQVDSTQLNTEGKVLFAQLKSHAREIVTNLKELRLPPLVANQLRQLIDNSSAALLCDLLVTLLDLKYEDQLVIFNAVDLNDRLKLAIELIKNELKTLKNKTRERTSNKATSIRTAKSNRPKHWSDQAESEDDSDLAELKAKLLKLNLPDEVKTIVSKEMKRLKAMQPSMADYQVLRNYLETLSEIPWNISSPEEIDISKAKQQLDNDHFGMDKIKKRILEYLSVCKLRKDLKGPIICLAGPPGVGKTSLGKSIANALGRKFHRISLGGIRDEAEIRGHRRTYVGSMPGVIIQGLKKCGVNNPVFLLDEVDKLCNGSHQGDPAAALLEVLDPEQNNTFLDHYINTPVDLSKVLFIATANNLSNMSAPLLDRMEIVELSGYTINEKRHIAKNHLIPKQVQTHGLTQELFEVPDDTLGAVISKYTREAGVRNLERTIAALCRAKAMDYSQIDQGSKFDKIVHLDDLENILGIPRFTERIADQKLIPGMAIGMVYSQSGSGAIMFLEATKMPGSGKLVLTGKLGQVLKESAQIALSWVKSNAYDLGLVSDAKTNLLEGLDIHVHLPEGATPKDGPSAGITLISCLVSLFSKTPIPAFLSMTGEVSLRGKVLPVGGIREKVISAHRAGIKTIILPELNRKDVNHQDLPDEVFQDIQFYFVSHITEVLQILFETRFKSKLNLISRL